MQINADMALVEAARRIGPVIREHSEEAERERRLSAPVLAALHESGTSLRTTRAREKWALTMSLTGLRISRKT